MNIYKSLLLTKEKAKDLVYFLEDDYIHEREAIKEMLFTYERISSQLNKELFLCPADYPFLYNKIDIYFHHDINHLPSTKIACTLKKVSLLLNYPNREFQFEIYVD